MAFDSRSTPEARALSAETSEALRLAVAALWAADEGAAVDAEQALAVALDRMVDEARTRALRAEEVVLAFKRILEEAPLSVPAVRRLELAGFRERLVTRCIKAYYAR